MHDSAAYAQSNKLYATSLHQKGDKKKEINKNIISRSNIFFQQK